MPSAHPMRPRRRSRSARSTTRRAIAVTSFVVVQEQRVEVSRRTREVRHVVAGGELDQLIRSTRELEMKHGPIDRYRTDAGKCRERVGVEWRAEVDRDISDRARSQRFDVLGGYEASLPDDRHVVAEMLHLV